MTTKKELVCRHRHTQKTHPQCFQDGKLIDEAHWWKQIKTGYLDIESTGFKGNYNYMISWAIEDLETGKVDYDYITFDDIKSGNFDKRIIKSLLSKLKEYGCIIGYYTTGFDIPFIRTRTFANGFDFPNYGSMKHIDLYYTVKAKLSLSSKSLETACRLFNIEGKSHIDPAVWIKAGVGNPRAVKQVVDHNIGDVQILKQLHNKLETQAKFIKKSI